MNDMSGGELLQKWLDNNRIWNFESNTKNLEKVVNLLGYRDSAFGNAVDDFLNDNPGAQAAIVEWIGDHVDKVSEWRENLEDEVGQDEEDDNDGPG